MEITEQQRERAEANRLAAQAKRKALADLAAAGARPDPWKLFKCRKVSAEQCPSSTFPPPKQPSSADLAMEPNNAPAQLPEKFLARLEICSPDSFSLVLSRYTQNHDGSEACVYKLGDYDAVLRCLKMSEGINYEEIPWGTFNVVERMSHSFTQGRWIPCRPEHIPDEKVDELIGGLPKSLLHALLPFQLEGVRFGLRRGGRCLIADEMGLGKTIQAIAIAGCFMCEGSILVVCPAILRYSWAEELERWLPFCVPSDIHLVFGHQNNPVNLPRCPRIVVISYTMLQRLRKSMLEQEWALLIVDESHHVRCSKKPSESEEIRTVLDVAAKVKRIVLLSGTPSLSRPGLLGRQKYEFAKTYCSVEYVRGYQGKIFQDFSKGIRLEELHVLLKQTVMIRRLKEHVMSQLPPKRRQVISLVLKKSDVDLAMAVVGVQRSHASTNSDTEDGTLDVSDECDANGGSCTSRKLKNQEIGIAKLSGFREWLSIHPIVADLDVGDGMERSLSSQKMIIFAHHLKVLDRVQEFLCEKGMGFVRIDGNTSESDRKLAIQSFQSSKEVKIAIIGILVGSTGLNLTAAQHVVFLELPKEATRMCQDTSDESRWLRLNKSLHRISCTMDGKYDAIKEIEVDSVSYLEANGETDRRSENLISKCARDADSSAVELMKFPGSFCDQDLQPDEACDEISEGCDEDREGGSCLFQKSNLQSEPKFFSNLGKEKDTVTNGGPGGNAFEGNSPTDGRASSQTLVEGAEDQFKTGEQENSVSLGATTSNDGHSGELIEACASSSVPVNSLRFEVSQYTGRVHLYSCIPGVDSRPRPLFENFRPEEVLTQDSPSEDCEEMVYKCIKDDPRYRHALLAFISEWSSLRPIDRRKLRTKPLQLPLSIELCCLNESLNHDSGGLLKGGSKRRATPADEISHPLPSNAVWRKVNLCRKNGGKEREYSQGWTLTDEPLCKLCQSPCKSRNAKVPEYFEDLFCALSCYEEYRSRTSNRFLREGLFQIEHGICSICKLDCHQLVKHIRPLPSEKRQEYIKNLAPKLAKRGKLLDRLVSDPTESNSWHAGHIVPVYQGGGECRLENMRTLCVACHADVQDYGEMKIQEIVVEDELLVEVPGSAYTGARNTNTETQDHERP
ncbi:hypothetical protein RJ639_045142 [Escallonia herrerae]|uniref:DNA annealing helicase and endonuclease ZRANB3 n=1 Tax=Escallonia herrerae TaxID=1293975 RepID=A0AA88W4K0_9ASTE|nr:hypothetical protein RJ639_045142 [Escallonia herrerae]